MEKEQLSGSRARQVIGLLMAHNTLEREVVGHTGQGTSIASSPLPKSLLIRSREEEGKNSRSGPRAVSSTGLGRIPRRPNTVLSPLLTRCLGPRATYFSYISRRCETLMLAVNSNHLQVTGHLFLPTPSSSQDQCHRGNPRLDPRLGTSTKSCVYTKVPRTLVPLHRRQACCPRPSGSWNPPGSVMMAEGGQIGRPTSGTNHTCPWHNLLPFGLHPLISYV